MLNSRCSMSMLIYFSKFFLHISLKSSLYIILCLSVSISMLFCCCSMLSGRLFTSPGVKSNSISVSKSIPNVSSEVSLFVFCSLSFALFCLSLPSYLLLEYAVLPFLARYVLTQFRVGVVFV